MARPLAIGERIAQRYRIDALLGEDALGYVYAVSEPGATGESETGPLALRLLRFRVGADGVELPEEALSAWRSQLMLLRGLRGQGIVPVHDICLGDDQGRVYVVRSAVESEGQPLGAVMQARPGGLSEPEAIRLCASIAEAVENAHQRGVLHLALSPRTVFIVPSGDSIAVRIADFALLPPLLAPEFGEPGYLAPEEVDKQPCDRRTDQFTVAVLFYELVCGQPAFIGAPDEDRQIILQRVVSEDPLPLVLSRPVELALARALSRSRGVRFPSLRDFVCALGVDGVAWSAVLPPGSAKSPPGQAVRRPRPFYIPVLLGVLCALVILAVYASLDPQWHRSTAFVFDLARSSPGVGSLDLTQPAAPPDLATGPAAPALDLRAPDAAVKTTVFAKIPVGKPTPLVPLLTPPQSTSQLPTQPTQPPTPPTPQAFGGELAFDFKVHSGGPLSTQHMDRIRYCLRLIRPRPPFTVVLDKINNTLYVDNERTTSADIRQSGDFRDCLKNEIRGNIEANQVFIKGNLKGKPSP